MIILPSRWSVSVDLLGVAGPWFLVPEEDSGSTGCLCAKLGRGLIPSGKLSDLTGSHAVNLKPPSEAVGS